MLISACIRCAGAIPEAWSNMTSVYHLNLWNNSLTGLYRESPVRMVLVLMQNACHSGAYAMQAHCLQPGHRSQAWALIFTTVPFSSAATKSEVGLLTSP